MHLTRRTLMGGAAVAAPVLATRVRAQTPPVIRLGVLTDLSGPYRDVSGRGSVVGVQQAAAEQMAAHSGLRVEIVSADHQNKPDVGAGIARQWFDQGGVDAVVDVPNSGVALAVADVCHAKNRPFLITGAGSSDLTGKNCAPTTVHWTFDTWMLSRSNGGALVAQGKKDWFFITADYAFGHALQRDAAAFVEKAGGHVVGSIAYPFPGTSDFSSFMVRAQAAKPQVLALANAGADTVNCVKQAHEFGLTGKTTIAAMLMFITDVHALGLATAQGLVLTETFYWDMNERTRAVTKRLIPRMSAAWRPNMEHAGAYAATLHYLKAATAMGVTEAKKSGAATVDKMKAMPTDDDAFGPGSIRQDGRALHPAFLFQVKSPAESHGPWDCYKLLVTTPADDAARPLAEGACAFVHA